MHRVLSAALTALSMVVLHACAPRLTYGEAPNVEAVEGGSLPPPKAENVTASTREFLVGPLDKVTIDVFGVEELSNREVQVDAAGDVSFPLVGTVDVAGRSPREIARLIEDRLRGEYIRDPQVSVNVLETVSQVLTVDGQVEEPGLYPVMGEMTLLQAVATAGGTTEYARSENVVVFRNVGEQRYAGLYNLEGIRRGNYPDPEIFPSDVVVVGESAALRRLDRVLQVVPLITSPLVLLLR